jgi:hypothetical protein
MTHVGRGGHDEGTLQHGYADERPDETSEGSRLLSGHRPRCVAVAPMRAGHCAVLDGTEYEALVIADGRWIFLPTDVPCPEGWKLDATRKRWSKRVERDNISSMCHVTTLAMLGDHDGG